MTTTRIRKPGTAMPDMVNQRIRQSLSGAACRVSDHLAIYSQSRRLNIT